MSRRWVGRSISMPWQKWDTIWNTLCNSSCKSYIVCRNLVASTLNQYATGAVDCNMLYVAICTFTSGKRKLFSKLKNKRNSVRPQKEKKERNWCRFGIHSFWCNGSLFVIYFNFQWNANRRTQVRHFNHHRHWFALHGTVCVVLSSVDAHVYNEKQEREENFPCEMGHWEGNG